MMVASATRNLSLVTFIILGLCVEAHEPTCSDSAVPAATGAHMEPTAALEEPSSLMQVVLKRRFGRERGARGQAVAVPSARPIPPHMPAVAGRARLPVKKEMDGGTIRVKLEEALPKVQAACPQLPQATLQDCDTASEVIKFLINDTALVPPADLAADLRIRLGINYFLWFPGPPMSFNMLDGNHDGNLTWTEMTKVFGIAAMERQVRPMMRFTDPDGDGNITRIELHRFLVAAIFIRDQFPEADSVHPEMSTERCLELADRVFFVPKLPTQMPRSLKAVFLLAIGGASSALAWWACSRKHTK